MSQTSPKMLQAAADKNEKLLEALILTDDYAESYKSALRELAYRYYHDKAKLTDLEDFISAGLRYGEKDLIEQAINIEIERWYEGQEKKERGQDLIRLLSKNRTLPSQETLTSSLVYVFDRVASYTNNPDISSPDPETIQLLVNEGADIKAAYKIFEESAQREINAAQKKLDNVRTFKEKLTHF